MCSYFWYVIWQYISVHYIPQEIVLAGIDNSTLYF